jgi:tRNA G18 (ribose-2'-O)-methylase SpoU
MRSAEGFGFSRVLLCGITPSPENTGVRKTALGAEGSVSWSAHKNAVKIAQQLRAEGYFTLALETHNDAVPLANLDPAFIESKRLLLIVGNEVTGVDPGLLEIADQIVCLPMHGRKRSLNVAVAFGAAALQIRDLLSSPAVNPPSNVVDEKAHR